MPNKNTERRFIENGSSRVRVSKREDGAQTLVGYAAVFYRDGDPGTEFRLDKNCVERIDARAFDRALGEDDVRALFNHSPDHVLGRTSAKTLRMFVDGTGLRYEIGLPNTQAARDLAVSVERGDITGSSFAFIAERTTFRKSEEGLIRQIDSARLYDVGPVTYPAYEGTSTGLRSSDLEVFRRELETFQAERSREADEVDFRADLAKAGLTPLM